MKKLTAEQMLQNFDDTLKVVQESPVEITQHGKAIAVCMSFKQFQFMKSLKRDLLQEKVLSAKQDNT